MIDKKLAKMDKVALLEMLCQTMEENENLQKRVKGMEEANAELMLRGRELEVKAEEAASELKQAKEALAEAEELRRALPVGNFAETLMQTYGIAQKTQAAAEEFLAFSQRKARETEEQAEAVLAKAESDAAQQLQQAQREAENVMQKAQAQADAMFREAEEFLEKTTAEAQEVLRSAQEKAEEETARADEHCKALEQKESEIRQRLRAEIDGLNRMVAQMDGASV